MPRDEKGAGDCFDCSLKTRTRSYLASDLSTYHSVEENHEALLGNNPCLYVSRFLLTKNLVQGYDFLRPLSQVSMNKNSFDK